jgi:hypothetical protein
VLIEVEADEGDVIAEELDLPETTEHLLDTGEPGNGLFVLT